MKALILNQPAPIDSSPLIARNLPDPIPRSNEIRVKIHACAVCRTDLHIAEGELPPLVPDIVPGHQAVGVVDQLGPAAHRFKIGDRVGVAWLRWTCGQCRYCQAGSENLCPKAKFTGYHENGGYAQYALIHEDYAYAMPPNLDPIPSTPLLCAGIIGFRALRRANTKPACRVGLYGFGSSAHIAIQVARHWNCRIYVISRNPHHQKLARDLGAHWAGDGVPPEKLDSAILFAPVGALVPAALEALDAGGTLAIAGIYLSDVEKLNYQRHLFNEKTLCSVTANTRQDGEELLRLASEIPLHASTTLFPLSDANRALQLLKHDQLTGSGVLTID